MGDSFRAIVIEDVEGKQKAALRDLTLADLPDQGGRDGHRSPFR